ncbi:hypothetical protein Goshw_011488 [Gossypium schwendimanii]|uniref:Uncharacterized protein n=2 Tax=Gossypium TaxID=3633 RepID=A0A7J9N8N8_GOSSC|nr:hypothetical protein [Gossypium klotzschianum]MBA0879683.1 hypothetical protein [Gossypium schwendimanii]
MNMKSYKLRFQTCKQSTMSYCVSMRMLAKS